MPSFNNDATGYTVADYCARMKRNELKVNKDYQRTDAVWPTAARSFLIESILLGYPIPKLSIRETTNLKTRTVVGEIIDGQQRSRAILDFYENKFAISKRSEVIEARGKTFDKLSPEYQQAFISFRLIADVFTGATNDEIRELFRRINSYTVSLNPEEMRHAQYQGAMKWFIYEQTRSYSGVLERTGVLNEKSLARMADAKLLADITLAMLSGIRTTKAKELNELYKNHDGGFDKGDEIAKAFRSTFLFLEKMPELDETVLFKQHNFFSLFLAIAHSKTAIEPLNVVKQGGGGLGTADEVQGRLLKLADVLNAEVAPKKYQAFVLASSEKTNTGDSRQARFVTYMDAVSKG